MNIDDLSLGNNEFIIYVYDSTGNWASDEVTITVTDNITPEISSPGDVSYEEGTTGNLIEWTVGDLNPADYNITVDGVLYEEDTWINGIISMDIDGLIVGEYEIILNINDTQGNWASDTVLVVVTEPIDDITSSDTTSSESTPTSTGENTDTTETPLFLSIFIFSLGMLVFIRRKPQITS